MKKGILVALGLAMVACSQGDTHPPLLGDCDSCSQPIGDAQATSDAAKDASTKPDSSTTTDSGVDASDAGVDASDAGVDASDSSILDTGASG